MHLELLSAGVIFLFAVLHFVSCYYGNRNQIGLVDIYLWMTGVYMGFGPLLSYASGYQRDSSLQNAPLLVLGIVLLFYMGLIFSKHLFSSGIKHHYRHPVSPLLQLVQGIGRIEMRYLLKLYFIVWLIRLYDISLGGGFSGLGTLGFMLSRNYFVVIIDTLLSPVSAMVIVASVIKLVYTRQDRSLSFFLLILELSQTFTAGRREMVNVVLLAGLALFAVNRRIKASHLLTGSVLLLFMSTFVFPVFLEVRSELQNERDEGADTGIFSVLLKVNTKSDSDKKERWDSYKTNLQYRGISNYQWMESVAIGTKIRGYMWGESVYAAAMKALPRALRPVKYWHDHGGFIQTHLGMPTFDASDNLIAAAYVDFSFVGVFFYALFFGLFLQWGTVLGFKTSHHSPLMGLLIFLHFLPNAIMFEESINSIFGTIRSIALLYFFAQIFKLYAKPVANPFMKSTGTLMERSRKV